MNNFQDDVLVHYGMPRRSGRYPWGSGENPYQHSGDFLSRIAELKAEGLSETEIAKSLNLTSTEYRAYKAIAKNERRALEVATAKGLREKGYSLNEIAEKMGFANDSSVRSLLNENSEARMNQAQQTAEFLKKQVTEKGMIDVGTGVERELNISKEKLNQALVILEAEGYLVYGGGMPQVTNPGKQTNLKVLCPPGTEHKEIYNYEDIHSVTDYISHDGGETYDPKWVYPKSMDSDRLQIRYAEDGGINKDGVVEIRRGVDDLSLGNSHYAQVRILVDGTHYIKGMAVYSDDLPEGVDVLFNTHKKKGTPITHPDPKASQVLKPIKDDPENPFGSLIKEGVVDPDKGDNQKGGQSYYYDKDGNKQLSLINKRAEEGDWGEWADKLPSQFLSKQNLSLVKKHDRRHWKGIRDEIMARAVTVIPQTLHPFSKTAINSATKRRVAAYARVSTDSEEQLTSYEAQVDYYTRYIQSKPEWEFVKVYTDEGITAVNTKHRAGFKEMVNDALSGKIDLIVTKSVSRFARNTVDSLVTVRELKEAGVEVYFEKENIYTLDSKGELFITIMSSLAQEESRSISENVTWGQRKRFADGKVSLPYKRFLGFEKGEDGLPKIIESEAKIVRRIYRLFLTGKAPCMIARILTEEGVPTPAGKKKWQSSTVLSILTNEKYKGEALLQKSFTVDFLSKKKKVNEGEVPQYYVENSHEAIIPPLEFDFVQNEIARRKAMGTGYSGKSVLSTKLVCGDCGEFFGSKVWQSNTKYRRTIWQCNNKFSGDNICTTPHITENEIKERFLRAYNKLVFDCEKVLDDCRLMQQTLTDCTEIDEKLAEVYRELEITAELTRKCITENSQKAMNQQEYLKKYNGYVERYERQKAQADELEKAKQARLDKSISIGGFMFELSECNNGVTEFDDMLWTMTVDKAVVYNDDRIVFIFRNGMEIEG